MTELALSASNLANHLACRHRTELDLAVKRGELKEPFWKDPVADALRQRGIDHEQAYLKHLRSEGYEVVDLNGVKGRANHERVVEAAKRGADVIAQAHLRDGRFHGYADFLIKVPEKSDLGNWSYDVVDTKLAQETRGGTILQLALYADLLHTVQGRAAEHMIVVKPGEDFPTDQYRFADFHAYYRLVRERLEAFADKNHQEVYPAPVPHCDICIWWKRCDDRRHDDDHLSLVAGLSTAHTKELERQGIGTLEAFAKAAEPLKEEPRHGRRKTYERLQEQAEVQLEQRVQGRPVSKLLPHEPDRGLARLPDPSPGDLFLDFEGNPYVDGGGLEYLTGYAYFDESGTQQYTPIWAMNQREEKRAFEAFIDFVRERQKTYPGLHIYHYAAYEPSALKRLAMRHATREDELDRLLRGERFVDLYSITKQGLLAGVESYSLKPLEQFFGYERQVQLREEASPALKRVACALEQGLPEEITPTDRKHVEGYNRDDCLSLIALQKWLEEKRQELLDSGEMFERPPLKDDAPPESSQAVTQRVEVLFQRLTANLPEDRDEWTDEQSRRWMLAHQLEYFHRERKVGYWEYFARKKLEENERRQERKVVVDLEFVRDLGNGGRGNPIHEFRFPPQEVSLSPGDDLHDLYLEFGEDHLNIGSVHALHLDKGLIEIRRNRKSLGHFPRNVHIYEDVPVDGLNASLWDTAEWIADHGLEATDTKLRAARDLLLRRAPRLKRAMDLQPAPGSDLTEHCVAIAKELDHGLLAIQGPPGAGKTYTGARMILGLAQAGHRVGVSATSHKVIRNLLEAVLEAAKEKKVDQNVAHKPTSRGPRSTDPLPDGYEHVKNKTQALAALTAGKVVGGVAWLWANPDCEDELDYLFLDEAGQMSLAQVLACARATKNLILLGDPLQLQQPQRGAHPEGAEVSALNHLLGEHQTMPEDLGLFLPETWRLPPAVCEYTSEVFYEGRLQSRPHCEGQRLSGPTPYAGAGLFLVHSEHIDNQSVAPEEVETVRGIVDKLLQPGVQWTDGKGKTHPLKRDDLLIIAPYNAQVAALTRALPGLDIGTVDRFQGQEKPVVLYSLTSSTAKDAPRGMSFLYDLHRLNVATSRAQCVCILVGREALFEPECRTPEQMRWANGVCRYREMAGVVEVD